MDARRSNLLCVRKRRPGHPHKVADLGIHSGTPSVRRLCMKRVRFPRSDGAKG